MKPLKLFFLTAFTLFTLQTKSQDDPNVGFYVDGVKVEELTCYTFGRLTVATANNDAYENYDRLFITIKTKYQKYGIIDMASYKAKYSKGKYFVLDLWEAEKQNAVYMPKENQTMIKGEYAVNPTRGFLAYYTGKIATEKLTFVLGGSTITSYREDYDPGCSCIKKIPIYSDTELQTLELKLSNQEAKKAFTTFEAIQMDLSQPCTYSGAKVDFNTLGKSGSSSNTSSNSNTNSNITNNIAVKTETPAKTTGTIGKTIITTVAPTSAVAVKPLDKTKPGYFEEKSEDKKFMYRNGYQKSEGVYHGEVREYDNNQLEKIIVFTDGIEDGLYVTFSDGKVEWQGTYKNGKKDGVWKHFNNGQLQESEKYTNGEKQD